VITDYQKMTTPPFHQCSLHDGTLWASFFRTDNGYLIHFPNLADFWISNDGLDIQATPAPGVSAQTIEHLHLNQVLPLALSRQFKLVLHGGAVDINRRAVAFLGVSGRGKSTLTAAFATGGYRFLTDDGLQLDVKDGQYLAKPSHPSIRLWDDSRNQLMPATVEKAPNIDYTPKARLLAGKEVPHCDEPLPLQAIYFLGEGNTNTVSIEAVSGRDAVVELVRHSFLLDIEEREMLRHHFSQLIDLAKKPVFFQLDYPRQYDLLPEVLEAVVEHVSGDRRFPRRSVEAREPKL